MKIYIVICLFMFTLTVTAQVKPLSEDSLNARGYRLLNAHQNAAALQVFKMAVETYPNSYNAYDSYAEAFSRSGKRDSAIIYYKKALQIFPNYWSAFSALRGLKAEPASDTMAVLLKKMIPDDIHYIPNITYTTAGRPLKFSVITEKVRPVKPLPVLVYFHGGGLMEGIKETGLIPSVHFARRGYFCVVAEYRLTNEGIFPTQLNDAKAVIRYLKAHAAQLHIDANKIGVWGESAGGYLSSLVGVTNNGIKAVCDWSGPSFFPDQSNTKSLDPDDANYRLFNGIPTVALAKKASPLTYITPASPTFLIFHGEKDKMVNIEHAEKLYAKLQSNHVPATFKRLPNAGHLACYGAEVGEISGGIAQYRVEMREMMDEFFDKYLKK